MKPATPAPELAAVTTALLSRWLSPRRLLLASSEWEPFDGLQPTLEVRMTAQEALKQQFEMFYQTTRLNLGDMTHEQSLIEPTPAGNRANWILGHVITVQNGVMHLLGVEPVWTSERLARITPDPATLDDGGLDWGEMKRRLFDSEARCLAALGGMDDGRFNEDVDDPFGGRVSRGELLGILAFHQTYHAGQFGTLRRLVGLAGAVKGPGQ